MQSIDQRDLLPWYRQFWFWFIFGPLIFIIIMCGFTVSIALSGADDVIIDNYYKEGRMINQVLDQDKQAKALGLSATIYFDKDLGEARLHLSAVAPDDLPSEILLFMGHPVKADKDQKILFSVTTQGEYRANLPENLRYSWYLTLYPINDLAQRNTASWTLSGHINFSARTEAQLNPRVK